MKLTIIIPEKKKKLVKPNTAVIDGPIRGVGEPARSTRPPMRLSKKELIKLRNVARTRVLLMRHYFVVMNGNYVPVGKKRKKTRIIFLPSHGRGKRFEYFCNPEHFGA